MKNLNAKSNSQCLKEFILAMIYIDFTYAVVSTITLITFSFHQYFFTQSVEEIFSERKIEEPSSYIQDIDNSPNYAWVAAIISLSMAWLAVQIVFCFVLREGIIKEKRWLCFVWYWNWLLIVIVHTGEIIYRISNGESFGIYHTILATLAFYRFIELIIVIIYLNSLPLKKTTSTLTLTRSSH